ncbi:GNAT family N-acetyltransferase [Kitasatospora sp. NPDC127111]|uniref:GNAT family N-acetyltransferase n=1 Tax=Kitasatospora sp. NPDC127111 TaxID=3345363 RepID=UPI00362FBDB5
MLPVSVHDRSELAALLQRDPALHAYELGDLDDFFWPWTVWYRHRDSVALVYHGNGHPTLLAFERPERVGALRELLTGLRPLLPRRFHALVTEGAEDVLGDGPDVEPHGLHLRMALTDRAGVLARAPQAEPLTRADLADLLELYGAAYPDNWFDPRMLDTGQYVGIRDEGELVATAGVHVWSPAYRIAVLGNVATHPRVRGRGLGRAVVSTLCGRLLDTVDHVALNVRANNAAAVGLYTSLGFDAVGHFHELTAGRQ